MNNLVNILEDSLLGEVQPCTNYSAAAIHHYLFAIAVILRPRENNTLCQFYFPIQSSR